MEENELARCGLALVALCIHCKADTPYFTIYHITKIVPLLRGVLTKTAKLFLNKHFLVFKRSLSVQVKREQILSLYFVYGIGQIFQTFNKGKLLTYANPLFYSLT